MTEDILPVYVKSVLNFRDVGGIPTVDGKRIKEKVIFRSASPDKITIRDIERLNDLNIRTIIDLRAPYETGKINKEFNDIQTISLPLDFERTTRERLLPLLKQKEANALIKELIESLYLEILDGSINVFRDIIDLLLKSSSCPLLIHCHAGKDRTGIISALIQMALGADQQSIIENYLASNEALLPHYKRKLMIRKILCLGFFPADAILYAITVRRNNIESVINRVITHYGGIEGYFKYSRQGISDFRELKEQLVI